MLFYFILIFRQKGAPLEDVPLERDAVSGGEETLLQGWLIRHKRGFSTSRWCVLYRDSLRIFKSPSDRVPVGNIAVVSISQVEVVDSSNHSDDDLDDFENDDDEDVRRAFF